VIVELYTILRKPSLLAALDLKVTATYKRSDDIVKAVS
jgi:hypothetical protein